MDFDKCVPLNEFFFHLQRADTFNAARALLRYYASFGDNIVYAEQGLAVFLMHHLKISRRTAFRLVEELRDSNALYKFDEFSSQLQPALSIKGTTIKYKSPQKFILDKQQQEIAKDMHTERSELWEKRGKNKRRLKSDENENTLKMILSRLEKMDKTEQQILDKTINIEKNVAVIKAMVEALKSELGIYDQSTLERVVRRFEVIHGGMGQ